MKVGIDISKDTFDVALQLQPGEAVRAAKYTYSIQGINKFKKTLSNDAHCVMEATGPYWYRLAIELWSDGYTVSVVNPLQIRRFAQMRLNRVKTDPADARIICDYAQTINPSPSSPPAAYVTQLKELRMVREQLQKTLTAFRNQLHALHQMHLADKVAVSACKKMITTVNHQMKTIDQQMVTLVHQECRSLFELLQSIPSIGSRSAMELIIATQGFTAFDQAKHFAAYIGICPRPYQSGTSVVGTGHICKLGMAGTRTILYLCSLSAVRCNKACQEFYQRLLAAGKPKLVALIAVANKLIRQIFAVVKSNKPFENLCAA